MLETLCCSACLSPLQQDDGHDLCPSCLGVEHLREGLSEEACPNCFVMPRAVRLARLAALDPTADTQSDQLPAAQPEASKRPATVAHSSVPRKKSKKGGSDRKLADRVDFLSSELAQMKALLQNIQPQPGVGGVVFHTDHDTGSVCEGCHFCGSIGHIFQTGLGRSGLQGF